MTTPTTFSPITLTPPNRVPDGYVIFVNRSRQMEVHNKYAVFTVADDIEFSEFLAEATVFEDYGSAYDMSDNCLYEHSREHEAVTIIGVTVGEGYTIDYRHSISGCPVSFICEQQEVA